MSAMRPKRRTTPSHDPVRAQQEEFGDLLAEGLYALFEDQPEEMDYFRRFDEADASYWERCIAVRRETLDLIAFTLDDGDAAGQRASALRSVHAAAQQLARLTPELCVDYLDAWTSDLDGWERATQRIRVVPDTTVAVEEFLGLNEWRSVSWETARRVA